MEKQQPKLADYTFLRDHALVKPLAMESTMGLVKPDQYDDKPEEGIVIAVGEGRISENGTLIPTKLQAGDRILFSKYSSEQIRRDGEDYLLVREEDIKAIAPRQ